MPPVLMNPWTKISSKFDYEHQLASLRPSSQDLTFPPASYAGHRISKFFRQKLYFGTVDSFSPAVVNEDGVDLWLILYDDGDREDFEKAELVRHLRQYEQYQHQDPMNATTTATSAAVATAAAAAATTTTTTTTMTATQIAASKSETASAPARSEPPQKKKKKRPVLSIDAHSPTMYDQVKEESKKRKKTDAFVPAPIQPTSSKKQSKKKQRSSSPKTTTTTTTTSSPKSATIKKKKSPFSQEKKPTTAYTTTVTKKRKIMDKDSEEYKKSLEGRRIAKYFGDGNLYFGTVTEYSPAALNEDLVDLWLIVYDDSDTEHLARTELVKCLKLYAKNK